MLLCLGIGLCLLCSCNADLYTHRPLFKSWRAVCCLYNAGYYYVDYEPNRRQHEKTITVVQVVDEEPIIDVITMSLIVESCEPYASLFTIKPSLPGIIITILSGIVPLIMPYVKQRLHF
ncbi:unnamed protein product [Rotaria magnacalcarata]|uniref:Uncharacterized protein n=1 Tax=Rotaria magnacalcarata TaxID=392030 RepID=A0A815Q4F1_9BILA|nr:unnamed protein product [Rotaria magnacalcarata]